MAKKISIIGIQYLTQKQTVHGEGAALTSANSVGSNLDLALNRPSRTTRSLAVRRALSLANMGSDADEEEEVHRFGITFHRNQRSKGSFKNELETIHGIGKQTAEQLLKQFKSVKNVKEQTLSNLSTIIGQQKATIVFNHYHDSKDKK